MGSWRRDGNDMQGKMFMGRGGRWWREHQEIAKAKHQNKEKGEEEARQKERELQKELFIASHRRRGMG